MADIDEWTPADDAVVRRAMATLRRDVDTAPMPDVRFVKARWRALRRRRFLTVGAAAAAAVIVASGVGYAVWSPSADRVPTVPATKPTGSSSSASPSPSTTSSLDQPGALPLLTEWSDALRLKGTVRLTPVKPFGPIECVSSEPGTKVQQEEITREPEFQGGQTRFSIAAGQDPQTAAEGLASDIAGCQNGPNYKVTPETAGGWPRLFSYTAGDAGSGWWAVVPGARDVVVLQLNQNDRATSQFTHAQVTKLADVAEKRLARYGTGAESATTGTAAPSTTASGPKAVNEKMPVSGPDPVPSSNLFVAASQWRDPLFYSGAEPAAAPADPVASLAVVDCETDDQQAGIAGRVGVVGVQAGPDDYLIGKQRVRVFDDADADQLADADLKRVGDLVMKGCTKNGNEVTAEAGPTRGTYLLTTKVTTEATGTMYQYVGVTRMKTPGAVSVVVFQGTGDKQGFQGSKEQGFAQLDRLLNLARQK